MNAKSLIRLVVSIVISGLAGLIGSLFTSQTVSTWFVELNKPVFNPPNWLFGPVWTLLYILIGVSLFIVWEKNSKDKLAYTFFGVQMALNALWSILFFGLKSPLLAFIEIIALWVFILLTILRFYKISKTSAYLLIPYILWVSFAAVLNFSIYLLN
ncbi:tryptophan-rich sensory protein [Candidatus Woesearchaeota archaeon]|nr:tryptophan-rich sensory protein [Candidatus Woesearchaeota archaeon]